MTLANKIAFAIRYLEGYTKRFKIYGSYCHSVQCQSTRVKVGGNALALKKAQLIPCTVVLYDKGGKKQRAGFLRVYEL